MENSSENKEQNGSITTRILTTEKMNMKTVIYFIPIIGWILHRKPNDELLEAMSVSKLFRYVLYCLFQLSCTISIMYFLIH